MDDSTRTALVRKVRTFADDVRRVQGRGENGTSSSALPVEPVSPPAPRPPAAPAPTARVAEAPANLPTGDFSAGMPPPGADAGPKIIYSVDKLDAPQDTVLAPEEGIIVKDTRRRPSIGRALGKSLTAWVDEQKQTIADIADTKEPEPRVSPSETRAAVIRAARQKSALAPRDDRSTVIKKLRTFASDAERATGKPYTALRPSPAATPAWSHRVDEPKAGSAPAVPAPTIKDARKIIRPLEAPLPKYIGGGAPKPVKSLEKDVAPLANELRPEAVFEPKQKEKPAVPKPAAPLPQAAADIAPLAAQEPSDARELEPEPAKTQTEPTTEPATAKPFAPEDPARKAAIEQLLAVRARHAAAKPEPPLQDTPEAVASRDIPFAAPEFATQKTAPLRTYRADAITDVEQKQRTIPDIAAAEALRRERPGAPVRPTRAPASPVRPFALAGAAIALVILIGGFGIFWYARRNPPEETSVVRIPTFVSIDRQKSVPFSENRNTLLETLDTEVRAAGSGVVQIYPARPGDAEAAGETAVPASEFLAVLDPRAPGSFVRNLGDEMMFGSADGAAPFFIFRPKQFDLAFAGMIEWEPYISADLTPLFGAPVSRTKDESAQTDDGTRPAFFADDTVENTPVRILRDTEGAERIVYGFVDKHTLIITATSETFATLANDLR